MTNETTTLLRNHLAAAARGVDDVMEDYGQDSVLITHGATYRGPSEIRSFFTDLLEGPTKGFLNAFTLHRHEVVEEVGYILWEAKPWFGVGTDTFVIRDGKIAFQTFFGMPPAD
jgi:hypothetical protein